MGSISGLYRDVRVSRRSSLRGLFEGRCEGFQNKEGFCKRFLQVFEPYIKIRELRHDDDRVAKTSFMDMINTFGAVPCPHGSNALFDHIEKAKHVASRKKKSAIEIPTDQEFPDEAVVGSNQVRKLVCGQIKEKELQSRFC